MTTATDTTREPDTKSAGTKLLMLLKSVVFISVTVPFPVKKSDRRRRIAVNLTPYACAGSVEYIVHSRPVLGVKRDLASYCIRRSKQTVFVFIFDS